MARLTNGGIVTRNRAQWRGS